MLFKLNLLNRAILIMVLDLINRHIIYSASSGHRHSGICGGLHSALLLSGHNSAVVSTASEEQSLCCLLNIHHEGMDSVDDIDMVIWASSTVNLSGLSPGVAPHFHIY